MTSPWDRPQPWVHLPVEVKPREFESRMLLACVAAERGFGAVVGAKHHVAAVAATLPRGIYVEKSIQLPGLAGFETRRALGHIECCLDEEGVVYIDDADYTEGRLAPATLDLMERFIVWGDDQAEVVRRFHPSIGDRLRVTGNPRVDLWRPELRAVYDDAVERIRRAWGDFVLVPTAFAMVNNDRGSGYFLQVVGENGRLDTERGRAEAEGYVCYSREIYDRMRAAVVAMAEADPGRRIVVRPHPSEQLAPWQELSAKAPNVVIVREGVLTPWLLAARVVVHNNSTSGLESVLLGRPTVAFVPLTDPRYDQNIPNAVSASASDTSTLLELVDAAFADRPPALPPERRAVIDRHITAIEGRFASERLVDSFLELDAPRLQLEPSVWRSVRRVLTTTPLRVRRQLARKGARPPATPPRKGAKFPPSTLGEVENFLARLRRASGRFSGVECRQVATDVYAFTDPSAAGS